MTATKRKVIVAGVIGLILGLLLVQVPRLMDSEEVPQDVSAEQMQDLTKMAYNFPEMKLSIAKALEDDRMTVVEFDSIISEFAEMIRLRRIESLKKASAPPEPPKKLSDEEREKSRVDIRKLFPLDDSTKKWDEERKKNSEGIGKLFDDSKNSDWDEEIKKNSEKYRKLFDDINNSDTDG